MAYGPQSSICRHIPLAFVAAALIGCGSGLSSLPDAAGGQSEIAVVTGFRLDVTVEEETLTEKRVRAVSETETTTLRRNAAMNGAGLCDAAVRAGDIVSRGIETSPGRMALTGGGAALDQSGAVGRVRANARVYFLDPMGEAAAAGRRTLDEFINTPADHPALDGAQLLTLRLDIVATPAGDPQQPPDCVPDLGASRQYGGSGERHAFAWHGVDLSGVPERYLARMLKDTDDVTVSVIDATTRVPIADARLTIGNLDGGLMDYAQFAREYLGGVRDAFILDLYESFADSAFFEFTAVRPEYRHGDILRVQREQERTLAVAASAPGYRAVTGPATVGGGREHLRVVMVPEDGDAAPGPGTIQTD